VLNSPTLPLGCHSTVSDTKDTKWENAEADSSGTIWAACAAGLSIKAVAAPPYDLNWILNACCDLCNIPISLHDRQLCYACGCLYHWYRDVEVLCDIGQNLSHHADCNWSRMLHSWSYLILPPYPAMQTSCGYVLTPVVVHQILQYDHHACTGSTFLGNTSSCSEIWEMQATTLPSVLIPIICKSNMIVIVGMHQEVVSA